MCTVTTTSPSIINNAGLRHKLKKLQLKTALSAGTSQYHNTSDFFCALKITIYGFLYVLQRAQTSQRRNM